MRLPFVIHITREKCQVCLYDGPGFSLLCDPPPRLSEKSRREQKSLYPTTGATTDSQSSLGELLLLRQSPPHTDCLKSLDESRKVCTPLQGDNGFSILTEGTFTFKTVSPTTPPRLSEKSRRELKSLYPTTGATTNSQSSLRVLLLLRQSPPPQVSARVFSMYSGRISGVCLQGCFQGASQVFAIDGNGHRPCKRLGHSQPFLT